MRIGLTLRISISFSRKNEKDGNETTKPTVPNYLDLSDSSTEIRTQPEFKGFAIPDSEEV